MCVQREMSEGFGDWGGSEEIVKGEGRAADGVEGERLMSGEESERDGEAMEMGALGGAAGRRETGMI